MPTENNLDTLIQSAASQPKEYENDGEKISNHSLPDLIAADKHLTRKRSARNPFKALKIARISTQGPEA